MTSNKGLDGCAGMTVTNIFSAIFFFQFLAVSEISVNFADFSY